MFSASDKYFDVFLNAHKLPYNLAYEKPLLK